MKKSKLINLGLLFLFVSLLVFGYYSFIYEKKNFEGNNLVIYNWKDYLPESTIKGFENKYNVKIEVVEYLDEFEAMDNLIGNRGSYDLFVASDYLVPELANKNLLSKIDLKKISNYKNIDAFFLNREFDKNNKYSVPYMWGTTGILYNKKYFNPSEISVNSLWDKNYLGKIGVIEDFEEIYFLTSRYSKIYLPLDDEKYFSIIKDEIINQKKLIDKYEDYQVLEEKMINEEIYISLIYSDSAISAINENSDLVYHIPNEGGTVWIDNWVILKDSKNKDLALKFIDYVNEPEVNKQMTEELYSSTTNKAAHELLNNTSFDKNFEEADFNKLYFLNEIHEKESVEQLKENLWDEIKDN